MELLYCAGLEQIHIKIREVKHELNVSHHQHAVTRQVETADRGKEIETEEREREREREIETNKRRETETQRHRQRHNQTEIERETQRERERERDNFHLGDAKHPCPDF